MRASGSSQTPPSCRAAWQVLESASGQGTVGVVEGRDSSSFAAPTYPRSPPVRLSPAPRGLRGPEPGEWQQPGPGCGVSRQDSQGAGLGPRCALPAEGTELLTCSSIQVKILPADTSTVCSAFRFVQENQLQQITQEAISSSGFLQVLFIWGSQRALQI